MALGFGLMSVHTAGCDCRAPGSGAGRRQGPFQPCAVCVPEAPRQRRRILSGQPRVCMSVYLVFPLTLEQCNGTMSLYADTFATIVFTVI